MSRLTPWVVEWRRALSRRRLLVLNLGIPLLLVAPVALSGAPAAHAAAVYAVLFVLFGTFGAAVPLVRDGRSGLVTRLVLTGVPPGRLLVQRAGAAAVLDLLELLPCVLLIALTGRGIGSAAVLLLTLGGTLLVANLLGFWVAALARSVAETALFSAVSALLLLHASGVFRTPTPDSVGALLEAGAPFTALHEILLRIEGGPTPFAWTGYPALALWASATLLLTWVLAPTLLGAFRRARGG